MHREIAQRNLLAVAKVTAASQFYLHTIHVGINDGIICPGHEVRIGE